MKDKDYPDYIDEISKIYENLWINILDGSKNSLSDYHTFSLATCSQNQVSNRTVVLQVSWGEGYWELWGAQDVGQLDTPCAMS